MNGTRAEAAGPSNKALQQTGGECGSRDGARHSASQTLSRSHRVERRPQLNAGVGRALGRLFVHEERNVPCRRECVERGQEPYAASRRQ
jgi:hypothetical protein